MNLLVLGGENRGKQKYQGEDNGFHLSFYECPIPKPPIDADKEIFRATRIRKVETPNLSSPPRYLRNDNGGAYYIDVVNCLPSDNKGRSDKWDALIVW